MAGFYYDYTDLQVARVVGIAPITENAARARIEGVEIEGQWRVSDALDITFGASYLDARYLDYPDVPTFVQVPGGTENVSIAPLANVSGNQLRNSPRYTLTFGASYVVPLETGELRLNGNYYYNDGYNFYADDVVRQGSFSILNARVGWYSPDGRYGISLYGKNIGNERYFVSCRCGNAGGDSGVYGEPRRYGVEFDVRF